MNKPTTSADKTNLKAAMDKADKEFEKDMLKGVPAKETQAILAERNKTHGDWAFNALGAQALKNTVYNLLAKRSRDTGLDDLSPEQREALDMICVKMSRIIAGDSKHSDHWQDIAGYATLASGE
jgi:hypothetical protein